MIKYTEYDVISKFQAL